MGNKLISNLNLTGDYIESKGEFFFEKAKEYKQEIAVGVVTVFSIVASVLIVKKSSALTSNINSSSITKVITSNIETPNNNISLAFVTPPKPVTKNLPNGNIINVKNHVRNLPEHWNPSISKVELAAKHGYTLLEHQTWVKDFKKVFT